MSIYDKDLLSGRDKVETAIERIRAYCRGKKTLVSFSGGKDSQCCYHLAKLAGIDFKAQYSITRFEPPELISFIRDNYPDVTFRRAYKRSLFEDIKKHGLPNRWFRWCCNCKHKKTDGFDIAVIGVRWAESARRRARWSMFGQKKDRTYYICPIVDWSDCDVWEFLRSNHIPHCRLYDEGFARIGCVCCPLSPEKMRRDAKRWPKIANVLRIGFIKNAAKLEARGWLTQKGKRYLWGGGIGEDYSCAFERWLDTGALVSRKIPDDEEPCLFAGTGFSESDGTVENDNR